MIEILTSGVALGVHVPGLLLADRLRERGVPVGVSVLERLLPESKLATTATMKFAFHRNFRVALAGQKVAGSPADSVDPVAVAALFADWRARGVDRVVVFSGFWLPLLAGYDCEIDVCHVDSVESPSFTKTVTDLDVRHVRLADAEAGTIPCSIPVSTEPPVPWAEREQRVFLHGGGWGMGTYRERVGELLEHGLRLDVIAYEGRDVTAEGVRYFMVDPEWHPWLDNGYPPFGQVLADGSTQFARSQGHHGSFDLTRAAMATVSKPGGGTLLDSLWSATPAVLLEPFGAHEQRNADLWCALGFGIPFDTWRESGFDPELLRPLHEALLKADIPDYAEELARR
ncbi:hypothetical protein [Kutzneria sp. CA-103260]|uniref:hypothetical protein n=1 Tax=Kutzneria sp. CA-103260 TaxID=2802641 RepID=UPI001BAA719F|nr:hypothetical protein [Kutzneria sp. CA-103260]QUQ68561.1 hypothetical protein JJ691_63070 [Kutzneria sp. CA-103260]